MSAPDIAVLMFGDLPLPGRLTGLPAVRIDDRADSKVLEAVIAGVRRVVVVGVDADLATVLTRLLRAGRLDVEVGYAPRRRTAATRVYRVPAGRRAARRARRGSARRVPLIRDETGTAIVGAAHWRPAGDHEDEHSGISQRTQVGAVPPSQCAAEHRQADDGKEDRARPHRLVQLTGAHVTKLPTGMTVRLLAPRGARHRTNNQPSVFR